MNMCSSCCAASCVVTVTVNGCLGLPLPGAAVEIRQSGVLQASGTTNSSGQVVLTVPRTAISAASASKTRFNNSGSVGVTTTGATAAVTITMTAASGFSCQNSTNCVTSDKRCPDPLPNTLTLTLSSGTKTLTHTTVEWSLVETRGGVKFSYATFGCNLVYGSCVLGNFGDPTCANTSSFSGPSSQTTTLPVTCPAAGFLVSGTLSSPYDSGSWSITE